MKSFYSCMPIKAQCALAVAENNFNLIKHLFCSSPGRSTHMYRFAWTEMGISGAELQIPDHKHKRPGTQQAKPAPHLRTFRFRRSLAMFKNHWSHCLCPRTFLPFSSNTLYPIVWLSMLLLVGLTPHRVGSFATIKLMLHLNAECHKGHAFFLM